jgi:hypothetical protein
MNSNTHNSKNNSNGSANRKNFDENDYFLILAIYFYLKNNGHQTSADILFKEADLGAVFEFPKDFENIHYVSDNANTGGKTTEYEIVRRKFVNGFFMNTFYKEKNADLLSQYWEQFWEIFLEKINEDKTQRSNLDDYLDNVQKTLRCN